MNNLYSIEMITPIGKQKGTLRLLLSKTTLKIILKTMDQESTYEGTMDENKFVFQGLYRKLWFRIPFSVEGEINDQVLLARVKTEYGEYQVSGYEIT